MSDRDELVKKIKELETLLKEAKNMIAGVSGENNDWGKKGW